MPDTVIRFAVTHVTFGSHTACATVAARSAYPHYTLRAFTCRHYGLPRLRLFIYRHAPVATVLRLVTYCVFFTGSRFTCRSVALPSLVRFNIRVYAVTHTRTRLRSVYVCYVYTFCLILPVYLPRLLVGSPHTHGYLVTRLVILHITTVVRFYTRVAGWLHTTPYTTWLHTRLRLHGCRLYRLPRFALHPYGYVYGSGSVTLRCGLYWFVGCWILQRATVLVAHAFSLRSAVGCTAFGCGLHVYAFAHFARL